LLTVEYGLPTAAAVRRRGDGASHCDEDVGDGEPLCRDEAAVGPDREVTSYNRVAPVPIVAVRPRTYNDS
jgi:hypothetical protein